MKFQVDNVTQTSTVTAAPSLQLLLQAHSTQQPSIVTQGQQQTKSTTLGHCQASSGSVGGPQYKAIKAQLDSVCSYFLGNIQLAVVCTCVHSVMYIVKNDSVWFRALQSVNVGVPFLILGAQSVFHTDGLCLHCNVICADIYFCSTV